MTVTDCDLDGGFLASCLLVWYAALSAKCENIL